MIRLLAYDRLWHTHHNIIFGNASWDCDILISGSCMLTNVATRIALSRCIVPWSLILMFLRRCRWLVTLQFRLYSLRSLIYFCVYIRYYVESLISVIKWRLPSIEFSSFGKSKYVSVHVPIIETWVVMKS
jgi:hypothetical protein